MYGDSGFKYPSETSDRLYAVAVMQTRPNNTSCITPRWITDFTDRRSDRYLFQKFRWRSLGPCLGRDRDETDIRTGNSLFSGITTINLA